MAKALPASKTGGKKKASPAATAKRKTLAVSGKKPAVTRNAPVKKIPVKNTTVKKTAAPARKTVAIKKSTAVPQKKPVKKSTVKKSPVKKGSKDMTRYRCKLCGYIYSPLRGEPHNGIPAGTAFEDLPDDYVCPVCAIDPKIRVQFGKVLKQGFDPLNI